MMILVTLWDVMLFAATVFAIGAACSPGVTGSPVLRLTLGATLALGAMFFAGFAGYVFEVPNDFVALLLAGAGLAVVVARRRVLADFWREHEVRALLGAWLALASWSIGLLALILSYSGGGWAGDWLEHWQRTHLFLDRQTPGTRFIELYSLTARPPLANVVIALWLEGTTKSFADFQVFMTLFGSLVLLPAWCLARRWTSHPNVGRWLTLVFMLSPFLAQNLTFAWTKLPTAFFVLGAIGVFRELRGRERAWGAVCLGLGLLTHYSAAPWLVAIAVASWISQRAAWWQRDFWREQITAALIIGVLIAPWVGWTITRFGWADASGSTTTAVAWREQSALERIAVPVRNTVATIVPFLLRGEPADDLITQESRLGRLRDLTFNLYQVNLPLALGFGGLWVLLARFASKPRDSARNSPANGSNPRTFWGVLVPLAIVLGIAVHTPPDAWGLAHICLQPLLVLGLTAVAATLAEATRRVRMVWIALATVDVAFGIVLHFTLQSCVLAPGRDIGAFLNTLNAAARTNALGKLEYRLPFLADRIEAPAWLITALLIALLAWTIIRVKQGALKSP